MSARVMFLILALAPAFAASAWGADPVAPAGPTPLLDAPVLDAIPLAPVVPHSPLPVGLPTFPEVPSAGRFSVEAETLLASLTGGRVPALVSASLPGTPRAQAGVEGADTTRIVFGDNVVNQDARLGLALRFGYLIDESSRRGYEVNLLWLDRQGDGFTGRSDGGLILARPYFDAATGPASAELIGFPGVVAGEVRVRTASDLLGVEVNYRQGVSCLDGGDCIPIDLLFGYRGLRYRDKVTIDQAVRSLDPADPATVRVRVRDAFYALNVFNGAQAGLAGRVSLGSLLIDGRLLGALGARFSTTDISGSTTLALPGQPPTVVRGGLLAAPSNIGSKDDSDFAFACEFSLRARYPLNQRVTLSAGYTSIYLSSVQRAGRQIDRVINTTQLPPGALAGPARPAPLSADSDVWARGFTLGVELRY